MSRSNERPKRLQRTPLDRQLKRNLRVAARAELTRRARIEKRLGWPLVAAGLGLFVATLVANFAGVVLLPFDMHHFFGQVGGLGIAFTGFVWAMR